MNNISIFICFCILLCVSPLYAAPSPPNLPDSEVIRLGEKMYRDGILPSGAPMAAYIRGDVEVDSSIFSCSSCHLRAGLGSVEGGVVTPPTTGRKLYKPYRRSPELGDIVNRSGRTVYAKTILERPPYTRTSLAASLRFGVDPAGQTFNDVMPRYPLSDGDMSILIRYLELLSAEDSPGASATSYKFATVITDDVSAEDRAAMLGPLERFVAGMNQQEAMYKDFLRFGYTPTSDMKNSFHRASLSVWELKGPPDSWGAQLSAFYAKEPVFALLGGISNQPWQPIHDFCEEQRLPCLFPLTALPVVSENSWYTYYFSKGYYQEGEAAARFINRDETTAGGESILQIVEDSPEGKALAAGFNAAWSQFERPPVRTVTITLQQLRKRKSVAKIFKQYSPRTLLLWSSEIPKIDLPAATRIFVSSGFLGEKTTAIPESLRPLLFITYPHRLTPFVGTKQGFDAKVPILATYQKFGDLRILTRTETMLKQAALQGLRLLDDNLHRDYLLDLMSMQMDQTVLDYERLSFGPGQRYVSKGCYIIQLGPGSKPELLPRSEWVIQ